MPALNDRILVIGYGSLLSGYGMLAERRGGRSRLVARDAWPITLANARRGLAKPSGHGDYLAMDLEPIDTAAPITARIGMGPDAGQDEIGALMFEFDRGWTERIAWREEYEPASFLRLLDFADRSRLPLGEYLLTMAERAAFNLDAYRRELWLLLGYTSPGYIFHPVPLDDGRAAIVAIGSGYNSSGHDGVISRRRECGMDRLLRLGEALSLGRLEIDREGQIGYFVECVLGGLHGIGVDDLMAGFEPDAPWARELGAHIRKVASTEREYFLAATSMTARTFVRRFASAPAPALAPLLTGPALG